MCFLIKSFCRRGKSESGDIDVLLTHPNFISSKNNKKQNNLLKNVVQVLETCGLITETLSLGETKFMVNKSDIHNNINNKI